jgi:hypothetical protein
MPELAQVKAKIPKALKRQAFATFALQDEKFNRWLERELRAFVQESDVLEHYHRERQQEADIVAAGKEAHG